MTGPKMLRVLVFSFVYGISVQSTDVFRTELIADGAKYVWEFDEHSAYAVKASVATALLLIRGEQYYYQQV